MTKLIVALLALGALIGVGVPVAMLFGLNLAIFVLIFGGAFVALCAGRFYTGREV